MDYIVLIVRFLHIVLGVLWVGLVTTLAFIIHPVASQVENGEAFLHFVYSKTPLSRLILAFAILTTLAGLFLYWQGTLIRQMGVAGQVVLGIGTLAGLAAFGHGIGIGRIVTQYGALSDDADEADRRGMSERLGRNIRVSAMLTLVAVIFMALARSVGTLF